jgi:hypothetical protein
MTMIHFRPTTLDLAVPTQWWWLSWLSWLPPLSWLPWVLMALEAIIVLVAAGRVWARRARQRRWQVGARWVTILAPPQPHPEPPRVRWRLVG